MLSLREHSYPFDWFSGNGLSFLSVGFLLIFSQTITAAYDDAATHDDNKTGLPKLMPPDGPKPQPGRGLCTFSMYECARYPEMAGKMQDERENVYTELNVGQNEEGCLRRAFWNWKFCGSLPWEPVTMTYQPTGARRSFPTDEAVEEAARKATAPLTGSGDGAHVSGLWLNEQGTALREITASPNWSHGMGEWKLAFVWVRDHVSESFPAPFEYDRGFPRLFNGELGVDKWVMGLFHSKPNGFFIDLAANEAVAYSNTLSLERLGWEGLCIEAQSLHIPRLLHRKCKVVQALVTREMDQHVTFNKHGSCGSNCAHVVRHESQLDEIRPSDIEIYPSVTFERIIRDFRVPAVIDFLSLDIEGSEEDAMSTFPFRTHKILFAAIEVPTQALVDLLQQNSMHFIMHLEKQDGEFVIHVESDLAAETLGHELRCVSRA
jgi:hypothetical protein